MLKKLYSILSLLIVGVILVACGNGTNEVQLPNLNGLNKTEITTTLNDLEANFSFEEEAHLQIPQDRFIRYGDGLVAGMTVDLNKTELIIYIAVYKILLPDLTSRSEIQVNTALVNLKLKINISYVETTDFPDRTFIRYGGTFAVGQEVKEGDIVGVVISRYPTEYRSPIFMSKYASGTGYNRAIEIYNSLENSVKLDNYTLSFYLDGDSDVTNSYVFPENTELAGGDTLLLVHPLADTLWLDKADILTNELTFVGKDYITLTDHKNSKIDEFGLYETYVLNFNNQIMVRNESTTESNIIFTQQEWDIYHRDHVEILDNHPTEHPKTFTFLQSDLALEGGYDTPRGMDKVTLEGVVDGDTAYFAPRFLDDKRIRFVGIDTPETRPVEPWGLEAKAHLEKLLVNAENIYVQHDPSTGIHDSYERRLGLVWADGILTNYDIVLNGFAQNAYFDANEHFVYEGVTLNNWFRRAEASARANRLAIWS